MKTVPDLIQSHQTHIDQVYIQCTCTCIIIIHAHVHVQCTCSAQFSRLGTLCPPTLLLFVCSFHRMEVSWVSFFLFASVLRIYISMCIARTVSKLTCTVHVYTVCVCVCVCVCR